MPPPSVKPATPTVETVADGVASPNGWVARSRSPAVAAPPTVAVCASASISTERIALRSMTSPPSSEQNPARLWPPPRTASSSPSARANRSAAATSAASAHRAITAGWRSNDRL